MNAYKKKVLISVIFVFVFGSSVGVSVHASPTRNEARTLINGIAYMVSKAAWATAEYRTYSFEGIEYAENREWNITYRIYAKDIWIGMNL